MVFTVYVYVYVEIGEIVTHSSDEGDGEDISSETEDTYPLQEKEDQKNKFITKSNDYSQDVGNQTIVAKKHSEEKNIVYDILATKSSVTRSNTNLVYGRIVSKEVAKYKPSSPCFIRKADI